MTAALAPSLKQGRFAASHVVGSRISSTNRRMLIGVHGKHMDL